MYFIRIMHKQSPQTTYTRPASYCTAASPRLPELHRPLPFIPAFSHRPSRGLSANQRSPCSGGDPLIPTASPTRNRPLTYSPPEPVAKHRPHLSGNRWSDSLTFNGNRTSPWLRSPHIYTHPPEPRSHIKYSSQSIRKVHCL